MPNWTSDQLKAINTTDKGVIVSAAAGSGKTAVLIERTIRLICDEEKKIPANKLLAVTFTNDAASQMREKLNNAINLRIEQDPTNEWYQMQQMKLQLAKISTINSFCFDLVKNNISNFEISSGVRILDDTENSVLVQKSLEYVLENNYKENAEMMKELNSYFCVGDDKKLSKIIFEVYKFSRSLPFKDEWFENVLLNFDVNSKQFEKWQSLVLNDATNLFKEAEMIYTETKYLASKLTNYSKVIDVIYSDEDNFSMASKVIKEHDYKNATDILSNLKFKRLMANGDNKDIEIQIEKNIVEKIKENRKIYKDLLSEIKKCFLYSEEQIIEDLVVSKKILKYLIMLVNQMWNYLWKEKINKNAIDFNDVELLSIKLLCKKTENGYDKTDLAKNIVNGEEYKIILIDEFQDVNNLQDLIFKMISDTQNDDIIGRNMFVVGDIKQSIYRFRQANPNIFAQTRIDARKDKNESVLSEIQLKKNFRSRKNIIDFVNFIFRNIMSKNAGEVDYNLDEELDLGADYNENVMDTEILVINKEDDDENSTNNNEPLVVANKICKMINEKYPVFEDGKLRPCKQSDFCILLRSKTHIKEYIESLKSFGLSVQSEEMTGYLHSREISILINLLKVIDNPMNDIALVSVLLSPVFMMSVDEIAQIKTVNTFKKFYPALLSISGEADESLNRSVVIENEELKAKCVYVIKKIKEFRLWSASLSLNQLIQKIYDSSDFLVFASAYKDGNQRRANLHLLLEYANSFENGTGGGITAFLRYIDTIFENGDDLKQAGISNNSNDSVNIKTIHKSKGLEYPFVFLCKSSTTFNVQKKDLANPVLINLYNGIGFSLMDKKNMIKYTTLPYDAIKKSNEIEMLSEEMRLLYVALTRAKEKIFITYFQNLSNQKKLEKYVSSISRFKKITSELAITANSMQDWLSMALIMYENNNFLRKDYEEKYNIPLIKTNADIKFIDNHNIVNVKADCDLEEENILADDKIIFDLKRYLDNEYSNKKDDIPSKLSVSEISKEESNLEYFYQIPRLSEDIGELSGAEIGTATHAFMEHANYNNAKNNIVEEIERLVLIGMLSKKQAKGINKKSLEIFFESEFFKRIEKSNNVMREKQFLVIISDLNIDDELLNKYNNTDGMLQGIADCIFEEEDGFVIVDYKTDNVLNINQFVDNYKMQLKLYKLAFGLILDKPVKSSYIYSFKLKQGIEIKL